MTTEQPFTNAFFYFSKELHINSNKPKDVVVCEVCQLVVRKNCMKAHLKSKKHNLKCLG